MLEHTVRKLQDRIRDSRLKEVIAAELSDLLADKPDSARTDEYIMAAAVLILRELKNEFRKNHKSSETSTDHLFPPTAGELDCETIINGLLIGMHHDLLESNLQMVKALGSAIAEHDYGTSEHNLRVTLYAVRLGESAGLEDTQMQTLIKGSFLHDVGKIGIREKTLFKPSQLSKEEFEDVKQHVLMGRRIIEHVRWLEDAVDIVLYHHENWDGSGYPDGLKGEQIPLLARVFSLADVFDALTSSRPYKPARSYDETMATMTNKEASRFDPNLLRTFESISNELHDSIVPLGIRDLEDRLLRTINHYFNFSPTLDDLRHSFGSLAGGSERQDS